jgi:thiol:disulfide interchange protein DsbC
MFNPPKCIGPSLAALALFFAMSCPGALAAAEARPFAALHDAIVRTTGGIVTPDEIRATPVQGLFEVRVDKELLYVDASGRYALLQGHLIDLQNRNDLTQARLDGLNALRFQDLPLQHAVKIVRGKGTKVVALFEDPECGFCQRVHRLLEAQPDVTIYAFPYPSQASRARAEAALCAKDKARAWNGLMARGEDAAPGGCATSIDAVLDWGRAQGIHSTPALYFADGSRLDGAPPPQELLDRLNASTLRRKDAP